MGVEKSLRDYTVSNFKHDCIKSGFTAIEKPLKLGAWNYIKLVKKPNGVAVYFNSKNDFLNARVLNDSNRGEKITKTNEDGESMTYQNLFIWIIDNGFNTLASDSFVEIEYSGENIAIEPLLGNTFSLSKIDSIAGVERTAGVNYVYPLENFLTIRELYTYQQSLSGANNIKVENNLKQILAKEAEIELLEKDLLFNFNIALGGYNERAFPKGMYNLSVDSSGNIIPTTQHGRYIRGGYFKNGLFQILNDGNSLSGTFKLTDDYFEITNYQSSFNGYITNEIYENYYVWSCKNAGYTLPLRYNKNSNGEFICNQYLSNCEKDNFDGGSG